MEPERKAFLDEIIRETKRRNAAELRRAAERKESARAEARRLAATIAELPGVRRVLLFGSATLRGRFTMDSDIDLAIDGGDVIAATLLADRSAFKVDVVALDGLHPAMREAVERDGEELDGAHQG